MLGDENQAARRARVQVARPILPAVRALARVVRRVVLVLRVARVALARVAVAFARVVVDRFFAVVFRVALAVRVVVRLRLVVRFVVLVRRAVLRVFTGIRNPLGLRGGWVQFVFAAGSPRLEQRGRPTNNRRAPLRAAIDRSTP